MRRDVVVRYFCGGCELELGVVILLVFGMVMCWVILGVVYEVCVGWLMEGCCGGGNMVVKKCCFVYEFCGCVS